MQSRLFASQKIARLIALGIILWVGLAISSQAQTRGRGQAQAPPPAPPTNLQVLPKDMSAENVLGVMQGFTQALGVQCWHCHADAPRPPNPNAPGLGEPVRRGGPLNYAADDKPQKQVARVMITMMNEINGRLEAALGNAGGGASRVQCVTCHRGLPDPRQLSDILVQTMNEKGQGYALSRYRELRTRYYGSQAYDFAEPVLIDLARRSLAASKVDDALAWLQLNLEFYPASSASYIARSQVHARKNDKDSAVADLRKALEIEPANAAATQQLEALTKGPK